MYESRMQFAANSFDRTPEAIRLVANYLLSAPLFKNAGVNPLLTQYAPKSPTRLIKYCPSLS